MYNMKIISRLSLPTILLSLCFTVLSVTDAKAQDNALNQILKRMEAHQKVLSSLRSKVTMVKYNPQLDVSDINEGTALYFRTAKNQRWVRIDWTKPVTETLSVINGEYVLYRPRINQAIVGKIDEKNHNVWIINALSFVNMSRKEIIANYVIRYTGQETVKDGTKTWHLEITPKKVAIYKTAELWVNGDGMPVQAKVIEPNNDTTTVLLSDFTKNQTMRGADFQINLPKGTKIISKSANSFSRCFKPNDANEALEYWSDTVFSGKVTTVNGLDYTFQAERVWKGDVNNEVTVRNFDTQNNNAIQLNVGQRFIVFARKVNIENKPALGLMPCNFTSNLISERGRKTLIEIGRGKPLKKITVRKKHLPAQKSRKKRF